MIEINPTEDITVVNIYAPQHVRAPKYIKQILSDLNGEINSTTITGGFFTTPLSSMHRSYRQKVNKGNTSLKRHVDQVELTDLYRSFRSFHPIATGYTLFSSAHGTFPKIIF